MTSSHLNFIDQHLIAEIVSNLKGESLERYEVKQLNGIDGFMSTLYNISLWTKESNGSHKERQLLAKFMKNNLKFRELSKSYIQFANEVFIYAQVLPLYKDVLQRAGVLHHIKVDNWVAPCYMAKFGYIKGLSSTSTERDAVLVLGNLKVDGYQLGPRLYLSRQHLLHMAHTVGQYHAMTYVLRVSADPRLDQLKAGILTLPFCNDKDLNDDQTNLYNILYRVAFDRFFLFFDRVINDDRTFNPASSEDVCLIANLRRLREKYFAHPTKLLENLRTNVELEEEDRHFAAILHGDYNRNNVLFRYKHNDHADHEVQDVKMIDFQELRYGSPAIDLSFFMYINSHRSIREAVWSEILQRYHSSMFNTLSSVLKAGVQDAQQLKQIEEKLHYYSYEHFYAHFSKFAFYGALICMHFLPWLLCTPEECERLSHLFETDVQGKEFYEFAFGVGGDLSNREILEIFRHASRMRYMDCI